MIHEFRHEVVHPYGPLLFPLSPLNLIRIGIPGSYALKLVSIPAWRRPAGVFILN